jgi:purine catabolism regulator
VVSVLNTENYPYDKPTIKNRFEHAFSNSGVYFGVSEVFFDIRRLKAFYKQSLYLVKNTSLENKEVIQFYDTVFFRHFIENYGIDSDYHWLIHPRVSLLESYDRRAKTNYIKCLRTYIECCCNKKVASEHLFIHYNTLVYRLERIREIADIDFDNIRELSTEMFHILLSCKLISDL